VFVSNGQQVSSFKLCLHKTDEWKSIQTPPTWYDVVLKYILQIFGGLWRLLFWSVSLLATVYITTCTQEKAKEDYKQSKQQIQQQQVSPKNPDN